jgi:LysW-gamma-L-lysine carboxypeptidase
VSVEALDRDEEFAFFRGLVESYSPSGNEGPVREYLLSRLPEMGFDVRTDEIGNVVASTDGTGEEVMLTSHMDTVPGEIPVRVEDGALYGRGSVDAKGPLASMFVAASRLTDDKDANVTVVAVVEEEKSGMGARHLTDRRDAPAYLVNGEPSGWSTVTLGYRGILRMRYRVTGEVIHTARPGVNAIDDVISFWDGVRGLQDLDEGFDTLTATPTEIDSESDGFELRSELRGNMRIPPEYTVEDVREMVKNIEREHNGDVYWGESTEPVIVDRSNPVVRAFLRSVRDNDGSPGLSAKTGTSDMNVFAERWDCPMATYGPGDSNLDHTPNEHIEVEEFHRAVDVLEGVADDLSTSA